MSPSSDGYEDALVCEEAFTRYTVIIPIATNEHGGYTASYLLSEFNQHVSLVYGPPESVHSDNASNLLGSKVWETFLQEVNSECKPGTPHNHGSQGKVERVNRTILQAIRKMIKGKYDQWPALIPHVQWNINTKTSRLTGY